MVWRRKGENIVVRKCASICRSKGSCLVGQVRMGGRERWGEVHSKDGGERRTSDIAG